MKIKSLTVIIIFSILILSPAMAGIKEVGNGGDAVAMSFRSIGISMIRQLKSAKIINFKGVQISDLELIIYSAGVETTKKELKLGGVRKDAINYPIARKIIINLDSWQKLSLEGQRQLIIHESMGLLKIEDPNYAISVDLEKAANARLGTCAFSKWIHAEISDVKKIGIFKDSAKITLDRDTTVASLIQKYGHAYLKIKGSNFEVNGVAAVGNGLTSINHIQDDEEYRLDCAI